MVPRTPGMSRHIARPGRWRSVARGERGAVAVEAGLLLPIFFLLVFGIIEFSFLVRDTVAVSESARVGVRTASALSKEPNFTQDTATAIQKSGSAMNKDDIEFILVYKANTSGLPGTWTTATFPADAAAACAGFQATCDKFVWNDLTNKFDATTSPTWDAKTVNACPGTIDSVGVYVQARHRMFTNFFGGTRLLKDRAVLTFEPRGAGSCLPTP